MTSGCVRFMSSGLAPAARACRLEHRAHAASSSRQRCPSRTARRSSSARCRVSSVRVQRRSYKVLDIRGASGRLDGASIPAGAGKAFIGEAQAGGSSLTYGVSITGGATCAEGAVSRKAARGACRAVARGRSFTCKEANHGRHALRREEQVGGCDGKDQ